PQDKPPPKEAQAEKPPRAEQPPKPQLSEREHEEKKETAEQPLTATDKVDVVQTRDKILDELQPEVPEEKAPGGAPAGGPHETRKPMSAIRQRIAERLVASQKATASLTTFNEVDMS